MVPNPTALRSLIKPEHVDEHRCVSCTDYDRCLETVLQHAWRSWSCGRCDMFRLARALRALELDHDAALRPYA